MMITPIDYQTTEPEAYRVMSSLERYVRTSGIDHKLLHLIKIRVSQINGCAYCIDMHNKEARADGEDQQRLDVLSAWRETDFFTPAEQAALAYAEAATLVATNGITPDARHGLDENFSPEDVVRILMAVVTINGWNRLALSGGMRPARVEQTVAV
jgi:AhpD family alkylhydroperoxidase